MPVLLLGSVLTGCATHSELTIEGRGELEPVADYETDAGRAQNRRVELHINR